MPEPGGIAELNAVVGRRGDPDADRRSRPGRRSEPEHRFLPFPERQPLSEPERRDLARCPDGRYAIAERDRSLKRLEPFGLGWPNLLSAFRLALVPVLVALLLVRTRTADIIAAVVFVGGAFTDGLDGYLARRFGATSRTGAWLDPLADKLLVGAPVVTLTALDRFPLWAAIVIVAREVLIVVLRSFLGSRGRSMPASKPAKLKTLLQLLAITLYILPLGDGASGVKLGVLIAAVVMTVYTGVDYAVRAVGWVRSPEGPAPPAPEGLL
jgi:CDP-diacylglycerol--glycerol-3-phosphate 3-phosphatidyltransferase